MVKFDTEKTGFETVFKPYQWEVIKIIYEEKNGIGSGAIHKAVTEKGITISRASIARAHRCLDVSWLLGYRRNGPHW